MTLNLKHLEKEEKSGKILQSDRRGKNDKNQSRN